MLDPADPGRSAAAWFDWGRESHLPADGTSWYHRMLRLPEAWDALGGLGGNRPWQASGSAISIPATPSIPPSETGELRARTGSCWMRGRIPVETGTQPIDPMEGSNAGHATSIGSVIAGDMR